MNKFAFPRQWLRRHLISYFAEWLLLPPAIVVFCYTLFGKAYFDNAGTFLRTTFVGILSAILVAAANFRVRDFNVRRFPKMDDWPKRLVFSIIGYLFVDMSGAALTVGAFYLMEGGHLALSPQQVLTIVTLVVVAMMFGASAHEAIIYWRKWRAELSEAERLEKLHLESQFQSLQNQMNPHFLFNSLNVLSSLIAENPRRAEDFVDQLSNVYRYLLRSNERELVSVAEELQFIRSFFHLLETRYDAGISLHTDIRPGFTQKQLPALALQILLENAVKHNEIAPDKPLKIEILDNWADWTAGKSGPALLVRNNIQRKNTRGASNRVGLDNLRQRYELLGEPGFAVHDDDGFFTVRLPLFEPSPTTPA